MLLCPPPPYRGMRGVVAKVIRCVHSCNMQQHNHAALAAGWWYPRQACPCFELTCSLPGLAAYSWQTPFELGSSITGYAWLLQRHLLLSAHIAQYAPRPCTQHACPPSRRGILGWLHNIQGHPLETLTFSAALPSSKRAGVTVVFDYISWLNTERDINVRTEGLVVRWAQHCTELDTQDEACCPAQSLAHQGMMQGLLTGSQCALCVCHLASSLRAQCLLSPATVLAGRHTMDDTTGSRLQLLLSACHAVIVPVPALAGRHQACCRPPTLGAAVQSLSLLACVDKCAHQSWWIAPLPKTQRTVLRNTSTWQSNQHHSTPTPTLRLQSAETAG